MSRVRRVILAGMVSVLLCASAAVSAGTVSVQPFCMAKEAALVVHTVIDIEYSYPEGQVEGQRLPERQRQVLRIDCNKRTGECDAAALSVVGLEKGRPISALDLIPISGHESRLGPGKRVHACVGREYLYREPSSQEGRIPPEFEHIERGRRGSV